MNQTEKPDSTKKAHQDAQGFAEIAGTIFAPIYPVIAGQILAGTSIRNGTALDVGTGPGHLATALATASDLTVHALDISPDMIAICGERVAQSGLSGRVIPVRGDVSSIPYPDATFDLVVSRGSWFFWDDLEGSIREIYRVLRPGGMTFIGGGFGTAALRNEIVAAMKERNPDFEEGMKERASSRTPGIIAAALQAAGIATYKIISDESGFWLCMVRS